MRARHSSASGRCGRWPALRAARALSAPLGGGGGLCSAPHSGVGVLTWDVGRGGGDSWRGSACVWFGDSCGRGAGGKAAPPAEGHCREALGAGAGTTGSSCLPTPTPGGGGRPFLALAASPGLAHGCLAAPWPLGPGSQAGPVEAEARQQGEACSGSTGTGWGPQGARGQKGAASPQAASLRCPPPHSWLSGSVASTSLLAPFPAAVRGLGADLLLAEPLWVRPLTSLSLPFLAGHRVWPKS